MDSPTSTKTDLFTRFQQRLSAVGGETHRVASLEAAASFIAAHPALATGELVIPPIGNGETALPPWGTLLPALRDRGIIIHRAESAASVADAPAGLSCAELAIAETGSVLLADNSLAARVVSMLTLTHFVIVSEHKLVPLLDEAGRLLQQLTKTGPDQRHYISFVTGPSRTADIERTLTIGVQGPKALCVLVVQDWEEAH